MLTSDQRKKSTKVTIWSNGPVDSIKEEISTREETTWDNGPKFFSTTEQVVKNGKWKGQTVKKK